MPYYEDPAMDELVRMKRKYKKVLAENHVLTRQVGQLRTFVKQLRAEKKQLEDELEEEKLI
jgi:uncharacterized protein (DUF3084 family)